MAGDLVEQAYQEGKFPAARRAFWHKRMAKRPKATKRELRGMVAMLPPPEDQAVLDEFAEEEQRRAAPAGQAPVPAASGPKSYPKGWLNPGEVGASRAFGGAGTVVREEGAAAAEPGEML